MPRKNVNPLFGLKTHIHCVFTSHRYSPYTMMARKRFNSSRHSVNPFKIKGNNFRVEYGLHLKAQRTWLSSKMIAIFSLLTALPLLWWLNSSNASILSAQKLSSFLQTSTISITPPSSKTVKTATFLLPKKFLPWLHLRIKLGDSLSLIFKEHQLDQAQLHKLFELDDEYVKHLRQLPLTQALHIKRDVEGRVEELTLVLNNFDELHIFKRESGAYQGEIQKIGTFTKERVSVHSQVETSYALAAKKVGLSDNSIYQLAQIFNGAIDFESDIGQGDQFTVIYEQQRRQEEVKEGVILAAEFVNQGKIYSAFRYTDPTGYADYYTPMGDSLNKISLFRAPLEEYKRISSPFGKRRHPISRRTHFHTGTDYAANRGVHIFAGGNGTVQFVGRKGGYGKVIVLEHTQRVITLYAHLSKYVDDLSIGDKVVQGQIIGYVGSTGRSTGPHLHYEIRLDDEPQNPQEVELPLSTPIAEENRIHFADETQQWVAELNKLNPLTTPTRFVQQIQFDDLKTTVSKVAKSRIFESVLEQHFIP
ncbi:MAG: M23 family metallopeptidase [Thiomargarita sp.]|nr:M23 family metallopeptidase [Thiomargarita sp.]